MDLPSVVRTITARLEAELQGTVDIAHSASKGRVREALVLEQVLRRVLPETVGLAHGAEIVSSDGTTSGECDIVVYDRDVPLLYRAETFTVIPIEAAMGVIEVKSMLDARELARAVPSLHRIKKMPRSALRRDRDDPRRVGRYGRLWPTVPVSAHIVAFDSIDIRSLADQLRALEQGRSQWECLDSVYSLTKGYLMDASGNPQRLIVESDARGQVVLAMVIELLNLFQRTWQPRFDPGPYLAGGEQPLGIVAGVFGTWGQDGSPST